MLYVYVVLITLGTNVGLFVGLLLLARWAIPRYGAQAIRLAMAPKFAPPVVPPIRDKQTLS
jgi:hypothetical protein